MGFFWIISFGLVLWPKDTLFSALRTNSSLFGYIFNWALLPEDSKSIWSSDYWAFYKSGAVTTDPALDANWQ